MFDGRATGILVGSITAVGGSDGSKSVAASDGRATGILVGGITAVVPGPSITLDAAAGISTGADEGIAVVSGISIGALVGTTITGAEFEVGAISTGAEFEV